MSTLGNLRHLHLQGRVTTELYVSPNPGGRGTFHMPPRDRQQHGTTLLDQLQDAEAQAALQAQSAPSAGVNLLFRSEREFQLALQSLEVVNEGIELKCVTEEAGVTFATVYVPNGKLTYFTRKFQDYLSKDTPKGKPKNSKLVESISEVGLAAIRHFWTDRNNDGTPAPLPDEDQTIWWEVWLRAQGQADVALNIFRREAQTAGMTVGERTIHFPDRAVILAFGTVNQFRSSIVLLDVLAELRRAKECPTEFLTMTPFEQAQWVADALQRVQGPPPVSPAVCVLDTGVNREQPLLSVALHSDHVLTCFPAGTGNDHDGHGTEMAGLTLYGDLMEPMTATELIELRHHLEAVKILPEVGHNHPDLYGAITAEAVYRIESVSPHRQRVFCMAVTATDSRDRGLPSSWSGELDQISFGEPDAPRRLFFVSAGNTSPDTRHLYPDSNQTDSIHDPGQAWNVVTVGAYTERVVIRSDDYADWKPIATSGGLSPSSTTSLVWEHAWPLKPDIVLEGGNDAINPATQRADSVEDLSLLTTARHSTGRLFVATGDTSAAAALAARMAAIIQSHYPEYWPETIRALMIHAAEWTPAMCQDLFGTNRQGCKNRLRTYGYGVPTLQRALWCARNALVLVSQEELQPFDRLDGKVKTRDMHVHRLPWPVAELRALGAQPVTMRVTLSYFVEPSPGRRGWNTRHRYASHGLRFDVKRPLESLDEFRKRLNKEAREEEEDAPSSGENQAWMLGEKLRARGSVHSDWWTGTASELADCGYIGVYPVIGWWRERPQFERWSQRVRYSLIVSISAPQIDVDLYTPVLSQITVPTSVSV